MRRSKVAVAALLLVLIPAAGTLAGDAEDCTNFEALLKTDPARTVAACRRLADQDIAQAQYYLGIMYDLGQGVPQDYAEAAKWYRKAAEQNLAEAQAQLGRLYHLGQGVPRNDAEAVKWFRKAADEGVAEALWALGLVYRRGFGVPQDYVQAHMWFNLGAARGHPAAPRFRSEVEKLMAPDQIAEAQRLAREWMAAHPNLPR